MPHWKYFKIDEEDKIKAIKRYLRQERIYYSSAKINCSFYLSAYVTSEQVERIQKIMGVKERKNG